MYGGANSHMAIRCAEFNIPAAIGCGTLIYDQWSMRILLKLIVREKLYGHASHTKDRAQYARCQFRWLL